MLQRHLGFNRRAGVRLKPDATDAAVRLALGLAALAAMALPRPATAQSPPNWTGSIRCELRADAPGYSHQETQTWTLSGAAPTVQGSVTVYPATWSVTGQGSHDRTRNASRRVAQWTAGVPGPNSPVSAPVGFTRHPTGRQFDVAKWHAQLTAGGGYTGTDQFIQDGVAQPQTRLVMTLYEWQFPKIEAATTETQLTGSHTSEVRAFIGPLQPPDALATVTCTWALGRGSAPALPPSTMPPQPPATGAPVSGGAAPGGAATGGGVAATPPPSPPSSTTAVVSPASPVTPSLGPVSPGGLTAAPVTPGVTAATAVDPANFRASQTADGTVVLSWDPVPGAGSYLVGGPGTNVGVTVVGTSHTVTGIPPGAHTWSVATMYNPGGILTTADKWSKATATVANSSGRYRILLTGFRVHRPTFDDRVNGNGDEVYASAAVTTIDRRNDSVVAPRTIIRSATYGDVSRDAQRVRAGSFSGTGGLWAGDLVPTGSQPGAPSGAPSATRLPLALWEGTLRDGIDAVAINPVLWEEDGQPGYYNEWADANSYTRRQPARAAAQASAIKARAQAGDIAPFRGILVFSCSSASDLVPDCKPGNDRPVGISPAMCVGDTFAANLPAWCDLTIVMTREGIERALAAPSVGGASPGVIVVPLVEPSGVDPLKGGLDGSYELYLRAERVVP